MRKGRVAIPIGCRDVYAIIRFGANLAAFTPTLHHVKPGRAVLRARLTKAQLAQVKRGGAGRVGIEISFAQPDGDLSILGTKVALRAP